MYNLGELLDFANFLVKKEKEGNSITPEQYNIILPGISYELFHEFWKTYEETQTITDSVVRFRRDHTLLISGGVSTNFPTDYFHLSSLLTPDDKAFDIVTDLEWSLRLDDPVLLPTTDYPIARLIMYDNESASGSVAPTVHSKQIEIRPITLNNLLLEYIKLPNEPFYDYCVDNTTDEQIYMQPGWQIDAAGALRNANGGTVASAVTHPDSPALPYGSQSVEIDFEDQDHIRFAYLLTQKLGVNLPDQVPLQYSQLRDQLLNIEEK